MTIDYDDVQTVMPETTSEIVVDAFILVAQQIISDNLAASYLSDALTDQITVFLTAHLLHLTLYRQAKNKKIGDVSETYAELGEGLSSTTYGQIVKTLDTTGILANIGKTKALIQAIPSFDDSPLYG
jgi:hypothetical protein